jgi:hypothetical protein
LKYLLDANTYIEAKNLYYGMEICPGYWQWLDIQYQNNLVNSIQPIFHELNSYGDELSSWVKGRESQFLPVTDDETQELYTGIVQFVADGDYQPANRDQFLAGADPWLIAKAGALGSVIVTHETLVGSESKKVKIPNICDLFGIEYLNSFELLNVLEARFILEQ